MTRRAMLGGAAWAFALNLDVARSTDAAARTRLAHALLLRAGAIPARC